MPGKYVNGRSARQKIKNHLRCYLSRECTNTFGNYTMVCCHHDHRSSFQARTTLSRNAC
ncbi:hypothetical protein D3C75_1239310 [compost metagenome]